MNKKYELLKDDTKQVGSKTLYRIKALVAIGTLVAAGDLGGYVESEKNLEVFGDAWVSGNAKVYGDSKVSGNAWVSGDSKVSVNAWVSGDAQVCKNHEILWFSHVGSENGTLTVSKTENGLFVSHGCFSGTDVEFLDAVNKTHGKESKIGREYNLLVEVARSRISG